MDAPPTLREILLKAAEKPLVSEGRTSVYEMPMGAFEGSENYLLRVRFHPYWLAELARKRLLDQALNQTTSLTPTTLGTGYEFSQPLFRTHRMHLPTACLSDFIKGHESRLTEEPSKVKLELVHRAPGIYLEDLKDQIGEEALLQKLASLPDVTYREFLQGILWLTEHGLDVEAGGYTHLFLDESCAPPKLSLIDVLESEHIRLSGRLIGIEYSNTLEELSIYRHADSAMQARIAGIAKEIGFPCNSKEMEAKLDGLKIEGMQFARVTEVQAARIVKPLRMNDGPSEIANKLRQIEAHNASFGRT